MTQQILNDGETFAVHRGKINANTTELYGIKIEAGAVLLKTQTVPYSPTNDYHPATKLYVDGLFSSFYTVYDPQNISADAFDRGNHTGQLLPSVITEDVDNQFVSQAEKDSWNSKESSIGLKGTAFNKNFGTIADSVSEGNHTHTKTDLGLGNVDNTSDVNKPVSDPQQEALDLKVDKTTLESDYYDKTEADDLLLNKMDADVTELAKINVGDVAGGDYVEIDVDGRFTTHGNARNYKTVVITLNGAEVHPTKSPEFVNYKGSRVIEFSPSSDQTIYFQAKLPHDYDPGTDLEFHVHAIFESATTGNRLYTLTYSWANTDGIFPTETSLEKLFTSVRPANANIIGSFGQLDGTGKTPGGVLLCSLTRNGSDGTDTESQPTIIVFADFHYISNSFGDPLP